MNGRIQITLALCLLPLSAGAQFDKATKPSSPPPTLTAQQKAQLYYNQAVLAARAGQLAQAEALYRQMLQADPKAGPGWANLGLVLARQKRYDDALAAFDTAIRLEPGNAGYRGNQASIQWEAGRLNEALVSARAALERDPKLIDALRTTAGVFFAQQRYADAIEPLTRWNGLRQGSDPIVLGMLTTAQMLAGKTRDALASVRKLTQRFPKEVKAHLLHGDLAGKLGSETKDKALLDEARRAYQAAWTREPKNVRAAINTAVATELGGDVIAAIEVYRKAVALNPDAAVLHHNLGRLLVRDHRLDSPERVASAQKELEIATGLEPKNPDYAISLGFVLLTKGAAGASSAAGIFRAALQLAPRAPLAHQGLAEALTLQGNYSGAATEWKQVVEAKPEELDFRRKYARVLFQGGKFDDGAAQFREAARRVPKETTDLVELAGALDRAKRPDAAEAALAEALERTPKDTKVAVALAQMLVSHGKNEAARTRYEAIVTAAPKEIDGWTGLIAVLLTLGKKDDALVQREKWVQADPTSNPAHYQLGLAYQELGRDTDAIAQFRLLTLRKDDPLRETYRLAVANLYRAKKRPADEATELRRILAEERDTPALLTRLAEALEQSGKVAEAEGVLQRLVQLAPASDIPTRLALAALQERTGRLEEAASSLEDLVNLRTDANEPRLALRRVRAAQKQPDAATLFMEKVALAEAYQPNPNLVAALDAFYQADRTPEKFLAFTQRAVATYPKSPVAWRTRAAVLQRDPLTPERRAEVAACLQKVSELDEKDAATPLEWGKHLEALGKKNEAIAAYTLSVQRQRTPAGIAALKALGAPVPPEPKKGKSP